MIRSRVSAVATALLLCACGGQSTPREVTPTAGEAKPNETPTEAAVMLASQVKWEKLNPARGDKSPRAATVWGDRNGKEATGFLFNAINGFQSPPHIHNVSYRGVVIRGRIHNDDPGAEKMWMPAGSFWTQPQGAVHITAAEGDDVLAYIEIEEAPYLVRPPAQAFATKERPINVDPANLVWVDAQESLGIPKAEIAYLWGAPQDKAPYGVFLKLRPGWDGSIAHRGDTFGAVLVAGSASHASKALDLGARVSASGYSLHPMRCSAEAECVFYIRLAGKLSAR